MLVAKAIQGPTMARPKQLTSNHSWVLPSDKSASILDVAVIEGVARSATLISTETQSLIPQGEKSAKAQKEPSQMLVAPEESPRT
jgi:hypothetical protein